MPAPEAIIFDLDDTLIGRTPSGNEEAWRQAIDAMPELTRRHELPAIVAALSAARGRAWADAQRRAGPMLDYAGARAALVADALHNLGFDGRPDLAERLNDHIAHYTGRSSYLQEDAIAALERVRSAGIATALLTNGESRTQRSKIERFGLDPFFDHILVEEEIGAGKPFDQSYRIALERLARPSGSVWMVGDHLENDIAGPKRHGLKTVWYNPSGAQAPDQADRRADAEIAKLGELVVFFDLAE